MAETNAQRIAQLESIVNELTSRVAADPGNNDLPPLLAAAQAELADLQKVPAPTATATVVTTAAAPAPAAATVSVAPVTAPAAPAAPAVKPVKPTAPVARPRLAAKPMPPTVPAGMRTGTRPNPASPRPMQTTRR